MYFNIIIIVARRVGVTLKPIGFPTHFLLSFTTSDGEELFVDSFNGAEIFTKKDCKRMLKALPPRISLAEDL
jgi:regulator of sirC expression with transglutaminase-like and TPR domain